METRSYIAVLTYFSKDRVIGKEECDSLEQAKRFALNQLKYYPYVEVVSIVSLVTQWGEQIKSKEVLCKYSAI